MLDLFGNSRPWNASSWTSSDDRVRGGSSQSYLTPSSDGTSADFYGTLDTTTLGGAGFASQRTRNNVGPWNFKEGGWDGLVVEVSGGDEKIYTLILKDEILPRDTNTGREQSTISWEYSFRLSAESISNNTNDPATASRWQETKSTTFIPFGKFKPFYRGRPVDDKDSKFKRLDLGDVKRISIMMRSHFDKQSGPFKLRLQSISAATAEEGEHCNEEWELVEAEDCEYPEKLDSEDEHVEEDEEAAGPNQGQEEGWWCRLM